MSAPSSPGSAGSTKDSDAPATGTSSSARSTHGAETCSPPAFPESPSSKTCATSETELPSTSSAAASPAKTSASQGSAPASPTAPAPPSSSNSPESLTFSYDPEAGSSLRTYPDSFPQTVDEISPFFSRRWPTSGFTISPGECWTADTSEFPSGDGASSSSLADVLQADVPARYFLSPKAARGILRRAHKRSRTLPPHLQAALESVAGMTYEESSTSTPSEPQPERTAATPMTQMGLW